MTIRWKNNASVAFLLNFFLPGLGMCYLKEWKKAAINLAIAIIARVFVGSLYSSSLWPLMLVGISSGAWAWIVAEERDRS